VVGRRLRVTCAPAGGAVVGNEAREHAASLALLAVACAPLPLATGPETLAPLLFIAGLSFGPATISLFEALDDAAPRGSTEALSWVTTAESAGIATGAALSGWMVSTVGGRSPFAAASLILAAAAIGAIAWCAHGGNRPQSRR
jgi:predicted MFS family arabinose efflux permease